MTTRMCMRDVCRLRALWCVDVDVPCWQMCQMCLAGVSGGSPLSSDTDSERLTPLHMARATFGAQRYLVLKVSPCVTTGNLLELGDFAGGTRRDP